MSRTDTIRKLANAIRSYLGATKSPAGAVVKVWKHPPKKAEANRVKDYLRDLGMDEETTMKIIEGFKTYDDFNAWIKAL